MSSLAELAPSVRRLMNFFSFVEIFTDQRNSHPTIRLTTAPRLNFANARAPMLHERGRQSLFFMTNWYPIAHNPVIRRAQLHDESLLCDDPNMSVVGKSYLYPIQRPTP